MFCTEKLVIPIECFVCLAKPKFNEKNIKFSNKYNLLNIIGNTERYKS